MEKTLGLPVLASQQGKDVDNLILYVHLLMIVLFAGWLAYFAYCLLRFRRARNPRPITSASKVTPPTTSRAQWPWSKASC